MCVTCRQFRGRGEESVSHPITGSPFYASWIHTCVVIFSLRHQKSFCMSFHFFLLEDHELLNLKWVALPQCDNQLSCRPRDNAVLCSHVTTIKSGELQGLCTSCCTAKQCKLSQLDG